MWEISKNIAGSISIDFVKEGDDTVSFYDIDDCVKFFS